MSRKTQGPRLAQTERGTWEIRWTENGRSLRKSTRCYDRAEAEKVLARWLLARQDNTPVPRNVTVQHCLDAYWEGHVIPRAVDRKRLVSVHRWLSTGLGSLAVRDLGDQHTHQYRARRREGSIGTCPAQDSTIRRELGHLTSALRYAADRRLAARDDIPRIARPAESSGREKWLRKEQVDALLAALADEDAGTRMSRTHRLVVLGLATGARKGAIEALRWEHVEADTGLIRYDQQVRQQTRKRRVAVPVADWLAPHLERMRAERETDYVLDHPGNIRSEWTWCMLRMAKATGDSSLSEITPHVLRHTCATLSLRAGATLWQVAGLLGDTPETVAKTYGHHCADHLRDAANLWRTAK